MESALVEPRTFRPANLLGVPGPGFRTLDSDEDYWEEVIGIRPKSSPLPRRKSSSSEDECDEVQREPPLPGARRVSFADAKGLRLELVKEFDSRDFPKPPGYDERQAEGQEVERYSYDLSFPSPLPGALEELGKRVREQKIELESIELLPGTTALRGVARVLNVSFDKTVFVRTSLDAWASHFDLLAEYMEGSGDGVTDCFSFKLTLVPPFDELGARVDFCLRYETPVGTFWANNDAKNYVLFCHQREKEGESRLQEECVCRKSCLKAARQHFTTVDNSSLEDKVQSIEKTIPVVSKHVGVTQVPDSHSATAEEEGQKLKMERSQKNASRKSRRRAARQAKLKDLFSTKDPKPDQAHDKEASPLEPPSDSTKQGEPLRKSFLGSPSCSEGSSADPKGDISPAQSGESSEAEKSESIDTVHPLSAKRSEVTAATHARQPHLEEKLEQKQHSAAFITGENGHRPLQSMRRRDDRVCIVHNTGEESHSDVRLTEHPEGPVNAPGSFTFGTVLAPLYPLVCGQLKSEDRNLADQLKSLRGPSQMGASMENSMLTDSTKNYEESSGIRPDPFKPPLNDTDRTVPIEGKLCVSVVADSSTNPTDVDCQESEHECTEAPNNPQPTTDEDMTPSDENNEKSNACTTRAGLNHQGNSDEGPQALGCQLQILYEKQIMEATAEAETEAEEVFSYIQTQLNPSQPPSQPKVLQETSHCAPLPHSPPLVSACENKALEQQLCCEVAAVDFICTGESNEQDGVPPTEAVSTTHVYPEQGREREQLEELDPKCFMRPVTFEAADISVGDKSIPELEAGHGGSAIDLSQETLKASMEDGEEPDNGGNESTNNIEEGDITPTVEHEDSVDVSEFIKVNKTPCTHLDMLAEEIGLTLVEETILMQSEAERCASEDAATKKDYLRPDEEKAEDRNWEMMVKEEENNASGKEVMRKEVDENGERGENDKLKEKQTITEQQPLENAVGCEKREPTNTGSDGQKSFDSTEVKSQVEVETVKEPLVLEEQEVEEEKVEKDGDHDTENQHEVLEEIRSKEKENLAETDIETQVEVEAQAERISAAVEVHGAGKGGVAVETGEEIVVGTAKEERNEETERPEMGSHAGQRQMESDPSTPVSNVHECEVERVIAKENAPKNETTNFQTEMEFISEEEVRSITYRLHLASGQSKALSESSRCGSDSWAADKGSRASTDEPEWDVTAEEREVDSNSSDSPSDEEMELYMHRLRAAPSPQTFRSFPRDRGSRTGKGLSIDGPKLLSSSMPSISESVNEEQLTKIPDKPEKKEVENFQSDSGQFPTQDNQEYGGVNIAQWTSKLSCSNILKALLYITMCALFVVVGYHYDFLACFALYLLSIFWLYCRADRQSETTMF
ncbi:unnamed protein product [Gadus morhua 'NCC']